MKIKATAKATRRTRNRINEHGRFGFVMSARRVDEAGNPQWLLRSRLTKWLGWLPFNEFVEDND